jgi:hypothetical protein
MAVARLLPRLWDAPRLMRFLAGLALMALAFAAYTGLTVPAAPVVAETSVTTTVDVPAAPAVPATGEEQAVVTPVADVPAAGDDEPARAVGDRVPVAPAGSAYGSRAPPRR